MSERPGGGDEGRDEPPGEPRGPLSFPDPGAGRESDRWAHRRDPDLEPSPPRPAGDVPPPARPRSSPYGWLFGIFVLLVLAYIGSNTIRNAGEVSRGPQPGQVLRPFAVPLALSTLDGDANVATAPGQGQRGARPACSLRGPDHFNICALGDRAPLVLALVAIGEESCARQLDTMERVRGEFPGVSFAAVTARTDRRRLRRQIRSRGWGFPIGYDRDGGVFAIYGVVDCPTLTFAYPGRIAMRTTLTPLDAAQLRRAVQRLVEASRRRGWTPPNPA